MPKRSRRVATSGTNTLSHANSLGGVLHGKREDVCLTSISRNGVAGGYPLAVHLGGVFRVRVVSRGAALFSVTNYYFFPRGRVLPFCPTQEEMGKGSAGLKRATIGKEVQYFVPAIVPSFLLTTVVGVFRFLG